MKSYLCSHRILRLTQILSQLLISPFANSPPVLLRTRNFFVRMLIYEKKNSTGNENNNKDEQQESSKLMKKTIQNSLKATIRIRVKKRNIRTNGKDSLRKHER